MGGNGSHSSGSGTGRDFPPVFSWDWDGKRLIFVGVGRERLLFVGLGREEINFCGSGTGEV